MSHHPTCLTIVSGVGSRDEERLVRDLFRGYNKLIRPVQNMTQKVEVAFGLAFIQLINVLIHLIFAEMDLGQAEQHLSWPPVYTLFFVCLALVVVQGSAKS